LEDRHVSVPGPLLGRSWAASLRLSLLSLFTFSLLCTAPAHAQTGGYPGGGGGADTYTVAYSYGATTAIGPADYPPGPYTPASAPDQHVPSGNAYGGSTSNHYLTSGQSVTLNCTGAITATFTWNGGPNNDPAPGANSVIVVEQVNASWGAQSGSVGSDISGGTTTGSSASQTYTATRYSVQGGSSFSVTCTPTASASSTAPPGAASGAYANVGYTATAYPATINLVGTTRDSSGNLNILIGQGCTGSLTAGPATLSNYGWTVPGQVFDKFIVSTNQTYGFVQNIFADEWTKPNPQWHWSKDETVNVFVHADASVNGVAIGTIVMQKQVTISAPYYYFGNDTGGVFIDPTTTAGVWALHATARQNISTRGSNWQGRVLTPALFSGNGYGLWHFLQIITPGRSKTLVGGASNNCTENGNRGLDTVYPYDPVGGTYGPIGGWICDDTPQDSGDSPRTGLDDSIANANIDESFETYMMYHPPGNSEWVPLHKFQWRWYANDNIPGVSWTNWVTASSAGYVARSSSQRCYDHPFWDRLEAASIGSGW